MPGGEKLPESARLLAGLEQQHQERVGFVIKDSGKRTEFASGMSRDTTEGKIQYIRLFDGPMLKRWAQHLTAGAVKYPDVAPNVPNWMLACTEEEAQRFRASAVRHFVQWLSGETDEDHAAAVLFNINGYEYTRGEMAKLKEPKPGQFIAYDGPPPQGAPTQCFQEQNIPHPAAARKDLYTDSQLQQGLLPPQFKKPYSGWAPPEAP